MAEKLTDLVLEYQKALTTIQMDRFAELMSIPREALRETETSMISRCDVTIQAASKRNGASLEGELSEEEVDTLFVDLGQHDYFIPEGASPPANASLPTPSLPE